MIRYALKCANGHRFESWFQSADAYETLARAGHVSCAVCGDGDVQKELMAPRVSSGRTSKVQQNAESGTPISAPHHPAEQALAAFKKHVEANATYVGGDFAAKAREMHVGDAPNTPIYGEAAPKEARALIEDGIPVAPLPFRPTNKSN